MARTLIVKTGNLAGRRLTVDDEMILGRTSGDLTLSDPEVSGRHARLRVAGDELEIEDLGSTNGTFVNGSRIQGAARLSPGDVIRVGQTTLEFDLPPPMTSPTPDYVVPAGAGTASPPAGAGVGSPPGATPVGAPPGSPPGLYGTPAPGAYSPQYAVPPNAAPQRSKGPSPVVWILVGVFALAAIGAALFFFVFKDGGVSRAEFIEEAGAVCRDAEAEVKEIENQLGGVQNPEDALGLLKQLNTEFDNFVGELRAVEAPEEDQDDFNALIGKLEERGDLGKQAVDALERGDDAGAQAIVAQGDPIDAEIKTLADGLGIEDCAADL